MLHLLVLEGRGLMAHLSIETGHYSDRRDTILWYGLWQFSPDRRFHEPVARNGTYADKWWISIWHVTSGECRRVN